MLAKANRVLRPADFKSAVRRGRRVSTSSVVLHVLDKRGPDRRTADPVRFGFIVTKAVGNAVTRNLVRRRLRAVSREFAPVLPDGVDIVMRALPGSEQTPWVTLHSEVGIAMERAVSKG